MLQDAESQLLTIAVVVGLGLFCWSQSQLWVRFLGVIAFLGAFIYALSSGELLVITATVAGIAGVFILFNRRRRNRRENEQNRDRVPTVQNTINNNFNN